MEYLKDVKKKEENITIPVNENTLEERLSQQQKKQEDYLKMQEITGQNQQSSGMKEKEDLKVKNENKTGLKDPLLAAKTDEKIAIGDEELAVQTPMEKLLFEADSFAPRIGKTNSYALKLVKRQLLNLKRISEDKTDLERDSKLRFSVLQLKEACERYKAVKFRNGKTPKNWRHERVAAILDAAEKQLKNKPVSVDDTIIAKRSETKEKIDGINSGSVSQIKEDFESVSEWLKRELPESREKLNTEFYMLTEVYYKKAINRMESYLKKHISWSLENERRYLTVHDTITALKLEYEKLQKIDINKLIKIRDSGAKTFEDVLITKKEEVKVAEETVKENINVSAFAECMGSEVYKKTYEKDGKTVYDDSTPYSMSQIKALAKEQNLPVMYSDSALMQLREAQVMDYILGIKNREEETIGYSFSREVYQGNTVIMINKVRMMDNKGAFSEDGAQDGFTVPDTKFYMAYHVEKPKRGKFKEQDEDLKKRIGDIAADKIEEALKNSGLILSEARKQKLQDRLSAVKAAFGKKYKGSAKYVNKDLIIEKEQVYSKNKLLEDEVYKLTGKEKQEKNDGDQADIILTHSSELRLQSKSKLKDVAEKTCNGKNDFRMIRKITNEDGSVTERDYISEIRDLIIYYSGLDEYAEKSKSGKYIGRAKREIYNKLRDVENYSMAKDLFGGFDEQDQSDEEYVKSYTGYEGAELEKKCLMEILSRISEYKAIIEGKLALGAEVENDTEYIVKEKEGEKDSKKIGLWTREKKRLERLETELAFAKGKLITHNNERFISDENITFYRKKEDDEQGIFDSNNVEQPYVLLELEDCSAEPLFAHEPCIEDVLQGALGDCFLIGTIASIVEKNPLFIKSMMKENPDSTVTVGLYDPDGNRVNVTVKKTVPGDYSRGALWVKLIEKAYAVSGLATEYKEVFGKKDEAEENIKKTDIAPSKKREAQRVVDYYKVKELAKQAPGASNDADGCLYETIESGEVDLAFKLLTGNSNPESYDVIGDKSTNADAVKNFLEQSKEEIMKTYKNEIDNVLNIIETNQKDAKSKYIFVAGSYPYLYVSELEDEASANAYRSGVAGPHLYSLLGIEEKNGKKMVRLRNPWGIGKVHYISTGESGKKIPVLGDDTDAGAFLIHVEDFASCFKQVSMIKLTNEKN